MRWTLHDQKVELLCKASVMSKHVAKATRQALCLKGRVANQLSG
jgi:hypothetical protein